MRLTTRTDQTCYLSGCHQPATIWDGDGRAFYCEPCAIARGYEPPTTQVEAVQAEVGAADAAVSSLEPSPRGTAGGDYSAWAAGVPAPHMQVPIAYGSGWASGHSAGWKAGMAYTIARQAEGTL